MGFQLLNIQHVPRQEYLYETKGKNKEKNLFLKLNYDKLLPEDI